MRLSILSKAANMAGEGVAFSTEREVCVDGGSGVGRWVARNML